MFGKFVVLMSLWRENKGTGEACTVPDVIIGVVLGQVVHILAEEASLLGISEVQLGGQCQDLQLHYVIL